MKSWRNTLHEVIFEADTPSGKSFDIALLWLIVLSVLTVLLESVPEFQEQYHVQFAIAEWIFTGLFTIEYLLRLIAVRKPLQYATSFFGVVDLLAILPTFIGILIPGSASLRVVRILRLLRMFRVLKLVGFLEEARVLQTALRATKKTHPRLLKCRASIGHHHWNVDVPHRRRTIRIHEHSDKYLLGHCHRHHGWLWRHCSLHGAWTNLGFCYDDHRIRHHCRSYWNSRHGHGQALRNATA